jgi:WD40 repeat protein
MPWDILHVSPLRREECARFITEHLGKYRKSLPHQIIHRILEHPLAGNPLFLRTLLEELRVFGIHEELGGRVSHYLASTAIGDLFERVLERLEGDNARETVRTVLEVLWAARESFAEDELLQVSGLPPAIWSPIHSALDESLIGSGGRLAFSHDYLRQAVEDRYLKTEEDRRRIWRDMARFCAESMRDGRADLSHYVRRNAVRHFLQAEAWDDAVAALSDLEFIGSRAIAQELPEMLSDYSDAAALLPEGEAERARDVSRQNALDRYAREVAEYSAAWSRIRGGGGGAEPQAPRPLECVRLKTHEQTTEEVRRMTEAPDRLDVIRAFRLFVATHVAPLHAYADRAGFVSNLAQNDAPAGPVHEAGVRALARWTGFKLIRQFGPAERYNPVPNCCAILEGHDSPITCMAFSLDGRLIVSGSDDGTVRIWDTHTGQCIRVLDAEQGAVESLALSADGKRLVTLNSLALRVWDTHTGGILHVLENKEQWDDETGEILDFSEWHPGGASCVALSGDGGLIVSGGMTLKMWDGKTLELISTLEGHTDPIHTLCLSGCGNKILSVSSDSIRIWELTREECILCLEGNFNPGTVALGEDGTLVVGDDATLRVLDARTGECLRLLEGHQSGIAAVAMHPNGTLLVSGSYDKTLRAWNPRTGECLRVLEGLGGRIHRLALRADGISLISGGRDGAVWVWDLENSPLNRAFSAHTNRVNSLCLNRDGTRLLSASTDRTVRLWSADCSECLGVFEGHESGVACALFCNNDARVVSGDSVNSLRIWDSITGECLSVLKGYVDPADESARFVELSAHAAGSLVLTGSLPVGEREVQMNAPREGMVVQIWDLDTGRRLHVFHPRHSWVLSLDQSPNSREILSGGNDGSVRLWDSESGECLRVLAGHREAVGAAKFSPDGARIVSGADDGSLRVWDWTGGDCLLNLGRMNGPIEALDFSADGRLIFSHVSHGILAVWEASYGRCLGVFFLRGLSSVCVDARRGRVFAGFADGALRSYQFQVDTCLGRV